MSADGRHLLGRRGEDLARTHLEKAGYRVITTNFRTRCGEIDLIAREGETLVFIEVKTRSGSRFGSPFEAITERKRRQISKVALEYLSGHGGLEQPARFDVVAVRPGASRQVEVIKNAFDLCYDL